MKKITFLAIFLLTTFSYSLCYGDWYVINDNNRAVAKTKYKPNKEDLATRNEMAVFSKKDLSVSNAEYRGGEITEKVLTPSEKAKIETEKEKREELQIIENQMKLNALKELKAKGKTFKHIKEKDFE